MAKIYVRDGGTGTERLLIDPETFAKKDPADHFTLGFYRVSPDGTRLLYGFAASGSEQTTLKVFDLATSRDLPEAIDRLEFEYALPSWLPDSKSFTFSRRRKLAADAPPDRWIQIHASDFGTRSAATPTRRRWCWVAKRPVRHRWQRWTFRPSSCPAGSNWAIGQIKHGDETDITLYAAPLAALAARRSEWTKVCDRADLVTRFAVHGDDIYLLTAQDAPRFKVVRTRACQARHPLGRGRRSAGPSTSSIRSRRPKDALYVGSLAGVLHQVLRLPYDAGAKPQPLGLPADEPSGYFESVHGDLAGAFVRTRSWTHEGRLYRYDPAADAFTDTDLLARGQFDLPEGITSSEVMVASHDGVQVPLSIIHRKDLRLDGTNPTLLSGYGAYGHVTAMSFEPTSLAWLGTWRGDCRRACPRRRNVRQSLAPCRSAIDEAEHLERLHRLRRISDQGRLHPARQASGPRGQRRWHSRRPRHDGAARPVCRHAHRRWLYRSAADGNDVERPAEHS